MASAANHSVEHRNVEVARLDDAQKAWPTLLNKLLQDFSRVVQREVELVGARFEPTIDRAVVRALNQFILAVIGLWGLLCLIVATILLLHLRLEWWQAFGATGAGMLVIVVLGSRLLRR